MATDIRTRSTSTPVMTMVDVERYFEKTLSAFEAKIMKFFNDRLGRLEEKLGKYDENIKEIEKSLGCCQERLATSEKKLCDIEQSMGDRSVLSMQSEIDGMQSEIDGMKKVALDVQCQLNDLEQYGRRSNLRIFGLPMSTDNCINEVMNFFQC